MPTRERAKPSQAKARAIAQQAAHQRDQGALEQERCAPTRQRPKPRARKRTHLADALAHRRVHGVGACHDGAQAHQRADQVAEVHERDRCPLEPCEVGGLGLRADTLTCREFSSRSTRAVRRPGRSRCAAPPSRPHAGRSCRAGLRWAATARSRTPGPAAPSTPTTRWMRSRMWSSDPRATPPRFSGREPPHQELARCLRHAPGDQAHLRVHPERIVGVAAQGRVALVRGIVRVGAGHRECVDS